MTKNSDTGSAALEPGKSGAISLVRNALQLVRQDLPSQSPTVAEFNAKPAANPKSLIKAAWNGFVSDGELLAGYHAAVADAESQRTTLTIRKGTLDERVAAIDAELSAFVYQKPAAPRVLSTMSKILPFNRGE